MNKPESSSRWVRETLGDASIPPSAAEAAVLAEVLRSIRAVRHGTVQLAIQDGRVVQIDTTEKKRL